MTVKVIATLVKLSQQFPLSRIRLQIVELAKRVSALDPRSDTQMRESFDGAPTELLRQVTAGCQSGRLRVGWRVRFVTSRAF